MNSTIFSSRWPIFLGVVLLAPCPALAELALHMEFNGEGTYTTNLGTAGGVAQMVDVDGVTPRDNHRAADPLYGSIPAAYGPSGLESDNSLLQTGGQGVIAPTTQIPLDLGAFNQVTITGWLLDLGGNPTGHDNNNYIRHQLSGSQRMTLHGMGGQVTWEAARFTNPDPEGSQQDEILGDGSLNLTINGKHHFSIAKNEEGVVDADVPLYDDPAFAQSWMFFAVTYDGTTTTDAVKWYVCDPNSGSGCTDSENGAVRLGATNDLHPDLVANEALRVVNIGEVMTGIGNADVVNGQARAIDALMDDFRIYTSEVLSLEELEIVRREGLDDELPVGPPITILAGDFNDDGIVNAADYTLWRDNEGGPAGSLGINDTVGGVIGAGQYDLWRDHYGETDIAMESAGLVAAPEPTACVLIGMLLAASAFQTRLQRNSAT